MMRKPMMCDAYIHMIHKDIIQLHMIHAYMMHMCCFFMTNIWTDGQDKLILGVGCLHYSLHRDISGFNLPGN